MPKLTTTQWVLVAIMVVVMGVVTFGGGLASDYAKQKQREKCEQLKRDLAQARARGADPAVAETIERQLRFCLEDAAAVGVEVDPAEPYRVAAEQKLAQAKSEWAALKATDIIDPIQRETKRRAINMVTNQATDDIREGVLITKSMDELNRLEALMQASIRESVARKTCYETNAPGCGRLGVNEPHGNEKSYQEHMDVTQHLWRLRDETLPMKKRFLESQA